MQIASLISAFVALTLFAASLPVYLDVGGVYSQLKVILEGEKTVTTTTRTVQGPAVSVTFSCTSPNFARWGRNPGQRTDVLDTTCPASWTVPLPFHRVEFDAYSVASVSWNGGSTQNGIVVYMRQEEGVPPPFRILEVGLVRAVAPRYRDWLTAPDRAEATRSTGYNVAAVTNYSTRTEVTTAEVVTDPYLSENPYAPILRALLPLLPVGLLIWAFGSIGVLVYQGVGGRKRFSSAKF